MKVITLFATTLILFLWIPTKLYAKDNDAKVTHETYPNYPTINYGSGEKAKQIKRGEYLARIGDCIACHTAPSNGRSFSGGYPVKTPFGTLYSPNITPDKTTGIGNWSDKDFIKAMREGISPQGHYYYPAFPFLYFNLTTTADLKAIKSYLNVIPPVMQKNKKNSMMFPFNWRFLQLGWRLLFFHFQKTNPYIANPKQSDVWNRGNYLVNGLGHCGMCHTPSYYLFSQSYPLAAPMRKYAFTGNMVEGFFAPNISSALLKNTSLQTFTDVFLKDRRIGGQPGSIKGPMKAVNHDSVKYLRMDDIKAMNTYLLSVKSKVPPLHRQTHLVGLKQGKRIYEQYCGACHTSGMAGAPKTGDPAIWVPKLQFGLNRLYQQAINGIGGMPAKGNCTTCTNKETQYAVNYMISKIGTHTPKPKKTVPKPARKLTMQDGERIYETYCRACHDPSATYPGAPKLGDQAAWDKHLDGKSSLYRIILHTIKGSAHMPPKHGCPKCSGAEIKAAVKYMVQKSQPGKDYHLW